MGSDPLDIEEIRKLVKYCTVCHTLKFKTAFHGKKLASGNYSHHHFCKKCRAKRSHKDYMKTRRPKLVESGVLKK